MWKREEPGRPGASLTGGDTMAKSPVQAASGQRIRGASGPLGRDVVNIGKSVIIKGELSGSEDLTIEGQVEGKIELGHNVLTIGPNGRIRAQVLAKAVIVMGNVNSDITATEKIDIHEKASVNGDLVAPRVRIAAGGYFRGRINMRNSQAPKAPVEGTGTEKPPVPPQPARAAHH